MLKNIVFMGFCFPYRSRHRGKVLQPLYRQIGHRFLGAMSGFNPNNHEE